MLDDDIDARHLVERIGYPRPDEITRQFDGDTDRHDSRGEAGLWWKGSHVDAVCLGHADEHGRRE